VTDERPSDEEMDALIAEMVAASPLSVGTDAGGRETWALTPVGARVATQMAMSSKDDALAMFNALLDAAAPPHEKRPAPRGTGLSCSVMPEAGPAR
jgi:hypothetical protein